MVKVVGKAETVYSYNSNGELAIDKDGARIHLDYQQTRDLMRFIMPFQNEIQMPQPVSVWQWQPIQAPSCNNGGNYAE